jgi:hypothetical protein
LPHTPLKELFEKSSLRILKNFGKILKYVLKVLGRCGTLLSRRVPRKKLCKNMILRRIFGRRIPEMSGERGFFGLRESVNGRR